MTTAVNDILKPYAQGRSCIILQGRSLYDLELNASGQIQPLIEILRNQALIQHNLVMVQYSRSTGVTYDLSDLNSSERSNVTKVLSDLGIRNTSGTKCASDENEFIHILRALLRLGQQTTPLTLRDGVPLKFLILIEFSEHLLPQLNNGTHTDEQIMAIELALRLSNSLGFRKSQNYTILSEARLGLMESLIYQNMDSVTISQPGIPDKLELIKALKNRYTNAKVEELLTDEVIANLSSGTPNRSLESIFLTSEKTKEEITPKKLFSRKQSDIISLSEGTLEAIDHDRIKGIKIAGTTIRKPLQLLNRIANGLKEGNKNIPRNIILCGSPSSGKTALTLLAAANASVPAFNLVNPKSQWVGESERRTKVMLNLLRELGGLGLIDEIELQLPMNRNQNSSDSGVTQNLIGQLQSFLADTSLAGKVCLVGTSNRPNAISEAMRQRWIVLPVLMPLEQDYPEIIMSIAESLNPEISVDLGNPRLLAASERFSSTNAAPREIREALIASQAILPNTLSIEHIEFASHDIIPNNNSIASIFSDYVALSYCRNNSFLPWWDDEKNLPALDFPFPGYIREILSDDLSIDHQKLSKLIAELEPYVNI
ncbi:MAG: AAA family ATPase [Bacteroidales bacterium]|nr:AAA family ATPase [Acholeplasmataceae bacterium]MCK9447757.1 AAA family ATPase [Bacteroidales bacterium]